MGANCCCIQVDEFPEVHNAKIVRARKEYTCGECGELIKTGRMYERVNTMFEGHWSTHITCARCVNVRDEYFGCGWYYGKVVEDFKEWFGFDYRDGIPEDFTPCGKPEPEPIIENDSIET